MRALVSALLGLALVATGGAVSRADDPDRSVDAAIAEVAPYSSSSASVPNEVSALTAFIDELDAMRSQYQGWAGVLRQELGNLHRRAAELTDQLAALKSQEQVLQGQLAGAKLRQTAQERRVGVMARLLYQQPAPELTAVEQILEGDNLRAFDRQDLVSQVLTSYSAALAQLKAEVKGLEQQVSAVQEQIQGTGDELAATAQRRDTVTAKVGVVDEALSAIAADRRRARAAIDEIRRREAEALRAAAAAAAAAATTVVSAAAAAELEAAGGPAQPTGGGAVARGGGDFRTTLPSSVPYRDVFKKYGQMHRVEPALLAGIARQESGFNAWAGCNRTGAGKGIMQIENQPQYCGPEAVEASVEKAARMLASYYNRSGSWEAAVFAYNNGPNLMDEFVRYSDDRDKLLSVLADYYNRQSYATPGSKDGYPSWGAWRARVAYSYASADPLPGFQSATQKWLLYRQG